MSSALILLSPMVEVSGSGTPLDGHLESLVEYRGSFRKLRKPSRGGRYGWLSNRGDPHEFNFGEFPEDEPVMLCRLLELFGGDGLLCWTYGSSVSLLLASSPEPGVAPEVHELGLRIAAPGGRRSGSFEAFCACFEATCFRPELAQLRESYAAPEISIPDWFAALGAKGAKPAAGPDGDQLWSDFERVATTLLQGEEADAAAVRRLNAELRRSDEESVLRRKPYRRTCRTARSISAAFCALEELASEPQRGRWPARMRAAGFYWDFTDCSESLARLTRGTDAEHLGDSASFGRLMQHYPPALYRDNVFWSLAANECESANGHAYSEVIEAFAEAAHEAGFTLAVFPSGRRADFREAFGIEAFEAHDALDSSWSAELFPDLPGLMKIDPLTRLRRWFAAAGVDGVLVRATPEGATSLEGVVAGATGAELPAGIESPVALQSLETAARDLDARPVFDSLGLPDLLEPGTWQEGAYAGERDSGEARSEREEALGWLQNPPEAIAVPEARFLCLEQDKKGQLCGARFALDGFVRCFRVRVPGASADYLGALRQDLASQSAVGDAGQVWVEAGAVAGYTRTSLALRILLRALGDLCEGARVVIDFGDRGSSQFVIQLGAEIPHQASWLKRLGERVGWRGDSASPSAQADEPPADDFDAGIEFSTRYAQGVRDESLLRRVLAECDSDLVYELDASSLEPLLPAQFASLANAAQSLGLELLGDLYVGYTSTMVLRGYCLESECSYFVGYVTDFDENTLEFYSVFADGSSLTTTTEEFVSSSPEKGIFYELLAPGSPASELWERHRQGIEERRLAGNEVQPVVATLKGLADAVAGFLTRLMA